MMITKHKIERGEEDKGRAENKARCRAVQFVIATWLASDGHPQPVPVPPGAVSCRHLQTLISQGLQGACHATCRVKRAGLPQAGWVRRVLGRAMESSRASGQQQAGEVNWVKAATSTSLASLTKGEVSPLAVLSSRQLVPRSPRLFCVKVLPNYCHFLPEDKWRRH